MASRYRETHKVALSTSFGAVIVLVLSLLLLHFYVGTVQIWHILIIAGLVFLTTYLVSQYAVDKFIYEKIKLIYKTIPSFKPGKVKKKAVLQESLEGMNEAVLEWGSKQQSEIEELKKLAAYRREFLGNISHELKTPIFNIQGYVLTLLDGGLEDPSINTDYLSRTEKSINRMIAIVEDLEEISKLESGEVKLNLTHFELIELIKDVCEFLEMKAKKSSTIISIDNQTMRPVMVYADKKRIRQVLINLIDNAIKYADKFENRIQIRLFDMDENFLIEVKDNGTGIPEESLPRIFERFYRTDKARSRDMGGTGLGLAIVKHIIEAHYHTLRVRSKVGQGTVFSFTLTKSKEF